LRTTAQQGDDQVHCGDRFGRATFPLPGALTWSRRSIEMIANAESPAQPRRNVMLRGGSVGQPAEHPV
jgi:hypothetical protein